MESVERNVNHVAVVGGTHGNELTGVFLVKFWQSPGHQLQRSTYTIKTVLANPKAIAANRRYLDRDLNRCFLEAELQDGALTHYEEGRAKSVEQLIGASATQPADFILDLHTTTSNMGNCLVFASTDPLVFGLAAYLSEHMDVNLFYEPMSRAESPYLYTRGRLGGALIEIGPSPQGQLNAQIYQQTRSMTELALDYIERYNQNDLPSLPTQLDVYQFDRKVDLPKTAGGELDGMVHEQLQGSDFQPLRKGDPIFRTFAGEEIFFQPPDDEVYYPAFINEAAYYDKLVGFSLLKKRALTMESSSQ